jgi:predicted membrane channel-forming protein YqfA (hemolysin III family)
MVTLSALALSGKPIFAAILMLEVVFYGLALTGLSLALSGRSAARYVSVPFYVLLGSLSTFMGAMDTCLGRRFAVWEIPKLSRGRDQPSWQRIQ